MSDAGLSHDPAAPIPMEVRLQQAYDLMEKMNAENEKLREAIVGLKARVEYYEPPPVPTSPPPPPH